MREGAILHYIDTKEMSEADARHMSIHEDVICELLE